VNLLSRTFLSSLAVAVLLARLASAQILLSGGTYSQNFDSLAGSGSANGWTNNITLMGWYAATNLTGPKSVPVTAYNAGTGSSVSGALYSFGDSGSSERALGSLASGSSGNIAFGVRFTNDTASAQANFTISYTGEQWRVANTNVQKRAFFYQVGGSLTNADALGAQSWTAFPALDFNSPNTNATQTLKGNDPTNRVLFTNVVLAGVSVQPGQEIFFRWYDANGTGSDDGLAIDDLTISFTAITASPPPVFIGTNSRVTLMTYNVKGDSSTDWSTNAPQVQAIGRQLIYLQPDVVTFIEIPYTNTWQMTNWVTAFMPGYSLAMNSATDGFIRSVIASRFPINRSQSWLPHADLNPFGYTNANFTRDLFEAEINVPNWPLPLHVFATHLKSSSSGYADAAAKRAAEAAAITNFFATNFFVLHPADPFTLSGDMNESDTNTLAIQQLISAPTTLQLINPVNPVSGSINTYSIQGSLSGRIDFIFPCALLRSNLVSSQVFRTDLLNPLPPLLNASDDSAASDHLPVLVTFANPFNTPFKLLAFARSNQSVALQWESATNRVFSVEASTNLSDWIPLAENLFATGTNSSFTTNGVVENGKFFRIRRVP
jgi:endonuclease/exonuclease/phosphatase family metal-dependent hydrolase